MARDSDKLRQDHTEMMPIYLSHVSDSVSGLSLGDSPHVPFPLPIEDDVSSVVVDTLPLPDLAKEAAAGRVIDL